MNAVYGFNDGGVPSHRSHQLRVKSDHGKRSIGVSIRLLQ